MSATKARAAAAPILDLYRSIMRVHRAKLAGPLKDLGDDYVKSEFRSHLKGKTTQDQWQQFVHQWQDYLSFVNGTADNKAPMLNSSGELNPEVLEAMSPEQRQRMQQLKEETSKFGRGEP